MSTREVILDGGSPWGFRMHGGADVTQPLRISRVNPGSKAAQKGIREGDLISSINGQSTKGITNSEAHALLRNSGETLILGLNQECSGSPKRRAQRILHEHKEESTEKISTTSKLIQTTTRVHTTIENKNSTNGLGVNHKDSAFPENKNTTQIRKENSSESRGPVDERLAPDDCSTYVHSTTNTVADCKSTTQVSVITERLSDKALLEAVIMADNVNGSSRSRNKRRSRSNRKKSKKCNSVNRDVSTESVMVDVVTHVTLPSDNNSCDNISNDNVEVEPIDTNLIKSDNYRVESPKTVKKIKNKSSSSMVKSKSLDDDDGVKITEITSDSDKEQSSTSVAVVTEVESDVEWEVTEDLTVENDSSKHFGKLSIISLPLVEHKVDEISHISPEDEKSLRDFLESLNLVGSAEESIKRIDKNVMENVKSKKAKKRQAIVEHFMPYYHNPRYLDVISEEGSDLSDREHHNKEDTSKDILLPRSHNARPLIVNPYFIDDNDIYETMTMKNGKFYTNNNNKDAVLVGTKIIDASNSDKIETLVSTSVTECISGAEIVYLEDSSDSRTPSDVLEQEEALDADGEDEDESVDISIDQSNENLNEIIPDEVKDINVPLANEDNFELVNDNNNLTNNIEHILESLQDVMMCKPKEFNNEIISDVKSNETIINLEKKIETTTDSNEKLIVEDHCEKTDEITLEKPKINITSSDDNFESRAIPSLDTDDIKSISLSHETPSQTKNNVSFNEQNESTTETFDESNESNNKNVEFLNNLITALSTGDNNKINFLLNNECYKSLPKEIKSTIKTVINSRLQGNMQDSNLEILRKLINKSPGMVDDEFNSEFKQFCDELNKTYDGSLSRPDSSSSDRSSRSTSQCTALYNPIYSSLTNIVAILQESNYDEKVFNQPQTLRELCIQTLLKMPFGKDVIEELASVSLSIEEMTGETYSCLKNIPSLDSRNKSYNYEKFIDNTCNTDTSMDKSKNDEKWVGLPTEADPSVLVCLSPSQKSYIETTRSIPKEADKLLDLHQKYKDRKSSHDEFVHSIDNYPISCLKISVDRDKNYNYFSSTKTTEYKRNSSYINYNSYLKQFTPTTNNNVDNLYIPKKMSNDDANINYNNYIKQVTHEVPIQVENKIHKPVNNLVYSGVENDDITNKRLSAKDLPEWVNLVRKDDNFSETTSQKSSTSTSKIRAPMTKLKNQHSFDGSSCFTETKPDFAKRRYSLPHELYERQMKYILNKEKEIQMEIEKLEQEKKKLENEDAFKVKQFDASNYQISKKGDIAILNNLEERHKPQNLIPSEMFRQKMYNEWLNKVAEREERKQHKMIKVSSVTKTDETHSEIKEGRPVSGIEDEFMSKVKERMSKLGLNEDKETNDNDKDIEEETNDDLNKSEEKDSVVLLNGDDVSNTDSLPKHLQEFVEIVRCTSQDVNECRLAARRLSAARSRRSKIIGDSLLHEIDSELVLARGFLLSRGVWSPNKGTEVKEFQNDTVVKESSPPKEDKEKKNEEPIPVVWTPRSAGSSPTADRKEFKPIKFESPTLGRKNISKESTPVTTPDSSISAIPPWELLNNKESPAVQERRLPTSHSAPSTGLSVLAAGSKLPKAQNPTITLLQKAREGQLPRGASYIEESQTKTQKNHQQNSKDDRPPLIGQHEIPVYTIKNEYTNDSDSEKPKKMADLGPRKFEGIGPTTKDGMPIVLRSEVKDSQQAKWYKRMYDTLHRTKNDSRYPYTSAGGYLSEPEPNAYDSDASISASKYATLDRRRILTNKDKENEYITYTVPRNNRYMSASVRNSHEVYKNQPGRIEDYVPGHSSISEKEAKEWWDEVMEIFDGHLEQQKHVPQTKSYMSHALKESGYESDSTLVFRRRDDTALQLNPVEQKQAYKDIQRGGEVPLHGLRKPAPERPKDDTEIEYFPISPTLTRIRVHKNKPIDEILCYPVSIHHTNKPNVFSTFKRTAPSSANIATLPPSPPKRKSSRNSHTLRLISTMTVHSPKPYRRHETCFKTLSDKSNVKFLRDKITCKLRPHGNSSKGIKITKTITTPKNESVTSTVCTFKDTKPKCDHISSQHYSRSTQSSTAKRCCKHCSLSVPVKTYEPSKVDLDKKRSVSLERTFGIKKNEVNLILPKSTSKDRFSYEKDLKSPTEVKKVQQKTENKDYPPGTIVKKTTTFYSSAKNNIKSSKKADDKSLNVTVAITPKGKDILNSDYLSGKLKSPASSPILSRSRTARASPVPSTASEKSKISSKSRISSLDSLTSPVPKKKISKLSTTQKVKKEDSCSDRDKKKSKKLKKDQNNEEIKKDKKSKTKTKDEKSKMKKCAGRIAGSEIVKKLKKMESHEKTKSHVITKEEIQKTKDMVQSESFFQHLFLRDIKSPTPSICSKSSWITEKSKIFEEDNNKIKKLEPSIGALKLYLTNRKPVTESIFRNIDREVVRSRSISPSVCSLRYRPFDSISEVSDEMLDSKMDSSKIKRSSSLPAAKIVFNEESYPAELTERNLKAHTSRSPSCRKIHSVRYNSNTNIEGVSGLKKKSLRARSAGEAEKLKKDVDDNLSVCQSAVSLSNIADQTDYKSYITETIHSSRKSERFKELNRFYTSLERLGQLERTTSSTDLRPRRKDEEEIIDYDRWMQVRTRERAEQEFDVLYKKLKQEQKDKDLLFKTKDVENFRWNIFNDRGLRVKEKSVENIKEQFEKLRDRDYNDEILKSNENISQKDVYKPLWRGDSVLSLASKMSSERRSKSESRVLTAKQRLQYSERMLTREIGSRLWSSLSMEQVNALRNQLAEIYSQAPPKRQIIDRSVDVGLTSYKNKPSTPVVKKSPQHDIPVKKNINLNDKKCEKMMVINKPSTEKSLSESEKKRLSLTLSQEVRDRINKKENFKTSLDIILGKETRGAVAAAEANKKTIRSSSPRTCYSLELNEDSLEKQNPTKDFLLVLTNKDDNQENVEKTLEEWSQQKIEPTDAFVKRTSSISETESASSDTSTRTAIFLGNKDKIHEKIEYFESGTEKEYVPIVYKAADDDGLENKKISPTDNKTNLHHAQSQSYADLKELFGEQELMKFATVPLSATRKEIYVSPKKPRLFSDIKDVKRLSDSSNIFQSKNISKDDEKYWMAYLALVKEGDVRRLAEKFEHLKSYYNSQSFLSATRRCTSDPEITRSQKYKKEFGDVYWLTTQYENLSNRSRSRTRKSGKTSPIPKTPLKAEDRFMPHINVISKLASLYPKKTSSLQKQKNICELAKLLGCPIGEVEKLREKFDLQSKNMSLLGHMFTSSPNLNELRDIAPYLTGPWIAHRFPKTEDNTKKDINGNDFSNESIKKNNRRPKSESPPRSNKTISSILKSNQTQPSSIFSNQSYDPHIHQPTYRYQPSSPKSERGRSWSPKHTVKFKEPMSPPTPPPKGQPGFKDMDLESPRKYVENEVTIHYRSPVRHEIKEVLSEEELARRQAEAMRRIYQEERRRKYLQELQDMNSRRHTDNFIPSQKSPIPLNRYDDFFEDISPSIKIRESSPEPRLVAKALYNFIGQTSRELTFRKGDIIFVRRQVDKNWFEGEHNAMVGLFPANYVEIVTYDTSRATPRKANEGQARAKFNFIAQTQLELSLAKGELVVLTRRVDDNWFEGRIGNRKGIFPVSYVEILIDPSEYKSEVISTSKPVASPASHSLLLNGSAGGKESMGSHHFQPSYTKIQSNVSGSYHAKPITITSGGSIGRNLRTPPINEVLHIDTHSEPVPYRALYKYRPQNDDELELQEGDTVFVLEKCDDGWYVGSSQRTGAFGTFPGNYVERI